MSAGSVWMFGCASLVLHTWQAVVTRLLLWAGILPSKEAGNGT